MIVDSHAYCFESLDLPGGHSSVEERLRWVQASHAGHHQPAWRICDRAPASSEELNPQGKWNLGSLPDVKFRADNERGRVVWTVDGEDYSKHFYPPNLRNLEFTPHSLIGEMDYAGVDVALLHTNPMLGRGSAFQSACVAAYPGRILSMAPVDEWRILSEPDSVIDELRTGIVEHKLHAIKFNVTMAYMGSDESWDGGPFRSFWDAAASLGVPVFFTLRTAAQAGASASREMHQSAYLEQLAILARWMNRYPDLTCSLTHGFPWRLYIEKDRILLPDALWAVFDNPNCNLEVCFPVRIGDFFDFPYEPVWGAFRQMVERIGSDRLLWGTDMPFQNRFCTYRQSRDWIEKHCEFLTNDDSDKIMGATAARILNLA
jgi:predicted TIM-barrel fold metal-dependent hydrolase